MTRLPVPGADDNTWGQILNDYLSVTHNTDGTLKTNSVSTSQIADASVTPAKLSVPFIPQSEKAAANGVATLDGSGLVPSSQLPPSGATPDATTTSKGIVQLAGDLGGTAAAPTVPGLANKVNTSAVGAASGVASLDGTTHVPVAQLPDATNTSRGIIELTGDLGGTAASPTVPALANKVDTSVLGAANGVATLDASGHLTQAQSLPKILTYSLNSTIYVKTGGIRLYNDSGSAWTILGVRASVGTAPTGSSIIIDVKINGTTIFTTSANRPAIVASGNTSGNVTNMDVTTIANGSYFTVDIVQIGSSTAGGDLSVQIEVR